MDTLKKVLEDKEFVEKVIKMEPEEAAKAFGERGIECTAEDLIKAKELIVASADGELSEEVLANVAGGGKAGEFIAGVVGGLGAGVVIGLGAVIYCLW